MCITYLFNIIRNTIGRTNWSYMTVLYNFSTIEAYNNTNYVLYKFDHKLFRLIQAYSIVLFTNLH